MTRFKLWTALRAATKSAHPGFVVDAVLDALDAISGEELAEALGLEARPTLTITAENVTEGIRIVRKSAALRKEIADE